MRNNIVSHAFLGRKKVVKSLYNNSKTVLGLVSVRISLVKVLFVEACLSKEVIELFSDLFDLYFFTF